MKRFLTLAALLFCTLGWAQDELASSLASQLEHNRVMFDFKYTINAEKPVSAEGTVIMQGDCFFAVGGGYKIFCDGESRWTLDEKAREVYIEKSDNLKDFLAAPITYLQNVYDLQTTADSFKGVYADPSGTEANFVISGIFYLPLSEDRSLFQFSESSLGKDWVVTDLR